MLKLFITLFICLSSLSFLQNYFDSPIKLYVCVCVCVCVCVSHFYLSKFLAKLFFLDKYNKLSIFIRKKYHIKN